MIARRIVFSLIFLALFFSSHCSIAPTDDTGVSLTGSVKLEGQSDQSGTTVAPYALAELDTMVVRMNKEFHTVGIPISQVTEFAWPPAFWRDHRLAKPVYQTQTKADGSYKTERIREGVCYLVAIWQ